MLTMKSIYIGVDEMLKIGDFLVSKTFSEEEEEQENATMRNFGGIP